MRRVALLVGLVSIVAVGGWLLLGRQAPRTSTGAHGAAPRVAATVEDRGGATAPERSAAKPGAEPAERAASKRERDALRRRITEAMQARERAAAAREAGPSEGDAAARTAGDGPVPGGEVEPPEDGAPAPGNLVDRTGNHEHLAKVMNEDLMPLVDECYALARETQPALAGMLVLDVEMIGDEDLGAVVESVAPGQGNELVDPSLLECVQESLLSTTLPPPPEGGKDAIALSLRLEPEPG